MLGVDSEAMITFDATMKATGKAKDVGFRDVMLEDLMKRRVWDDGR
jgi:hypothetical protein